MYIVRIHRDVLPPWCISSTSLLTSLSRVGKTLRIPRLQLLCERFLRLLRLNESTAFGSSSSSGAGASASDGTTRAGTETGIGMDDVELPPPTLARDLSALVGDPEFADVRFIAEGRAIVAHRFILEARCAYFRAMFRGGFAEGGGGDSDYYSSSGGGGGSKMVDVVVPGLCQLLL
jgi:hypothetical protein